MRGQPFKLPAHMLVPMVEDGVTLEMEEDCMRFLEEHLHLLDNVQEGERQQGLDGVPIGLVFRPGTGRERLARAISGRAV